jgi:hypothetical protein
LKENGELSLTKAKIIEILEINNIPYATIGKNISSKAIGINCPFCKDDEGKHLGIIEGKNGFFYTCWKNITHRGTLEKLFKYLHIKYVEDFEDLNYLLDKLNEKCYTIEVKQEGVMTLNFPTEFREIGKKKPTNYFYNYLYIDRGFNEVEKFIKRFNLKCAISGNYSNRIIIPMYENDKLLTWTSRNIGSSTLRYKSHPKELSVKSIKDCLFDYNYISYGGSKLIVTEGVFDSMKINWYSNSQVKSTCIFSILMSNTQIKLLTKLTNKFTKIYIILDKGFETEAMNLADKLSFLNNVYFKELPDGFKDLGEMGKKDIMKFCEEL